MELHACCSWLVNIRLFSSGCGGRGRCRPMMPHSCSIEERSADLADQGRSGGLEVAFPFRKSKVTGSTPAGVDRFYGW
ncbi:hypothetical protein TNCV_3168221 [Trichonephila clavipes]|nr:hypothetical protein TNCV_3168221 [Trichonephila clavipes]